MEKSEWPFLSSLFTPTTSVKFFLLYIIVIPLHPHLGLSPLLRLCSPLTKEHFESVWKVPDSEGVHRNKLRMNYPLTHCDTRILVSASPSPQNPGGGGANLFFLGRKLREKSFPCPLLGWQGKALCQLVKNLHQLVTYLTAPGNDAYLTGELIQVAPSLV